VALGQCSVQTIPGILHSGSWITHHGPGAPAPFSIAGLGRRPDQQPRSEGMVCGVGALTEFCSNGLLAKHLGSAITAHGPWE
jgi:hypothetical protein